MAHAFKTRHQLLEVDQTKVSFFLTLGVSQTNAKKCTGEARNFSGCQILLRLGLEQQPQLNEFDTAHLKKSQACGLSACRLVVCLHVFFGGAYAERSKS